MTSTERRLLLLAARVVLLYMDKYVADTRGYPFLASHSKGAARLSDEIRQTIRQVAEREPAAESGRFLGTFWDLVRGK